MTSPDYTTFRALAFDIYGTLIDWESSIITQFSQHIGENVPRNDIVKIFRKHERNIQKESPTKPYRDIADEAARLTTAELKSITHITPLPGTDQVKIADWSAFPDTVNAMQRLKRHYKLIALSNIDHTSFASTLNGPLKDVEFDAKYIAEDIGSYKPDPANFEYLISHAKEEFGIGIEEMLMVAHGLETDHAVLPKVGMERGVWIMRGDGERLCEEADESGVGARFETLGDFADAVESAFARRKERTERGEKVEDVGEALVELEEKGIGGS